MVDNFQKRILKVNYILNYQIMHKSVVFRILNMNFINRTDHGK